jgi:hypothetical protein
MPPMIKDKTLPISLTFFAVKSGKLDVIFLILRRGFGKVFDL